MDRLTLRQRRAVKRELARLTPVVAKKTFIERVMALFTRES